MRTRNPAAATAMRTVQLVLISMLLFGAAAAHADTVYGAVMLVENRSSLGDLNGMNVPQGLNLKVGNAATVGLGYLHPFEPSGRWEAELALGVPPTVRTRAQGAMWAALGVAPGVGVSDVDFVSPTLFVNVHLRPGQDWDPFVGVGVNYTHFAHARALPSLSGSVLGPTRIDLSDSWGPALHVGLIRRIDRRWSLLAAAALADVHSTLTSTSTSPLQPSLITAQGSSRIVFHPTVYTLALAYSF